jgi:Restriction endonuclease
MGITKRRIEAAESDINRELRLCVSCGERIEYLDKDLSWVVEESLTGPFTTIWQCESCGPVEPGHCANCKKRTSTHDRICAACLAEYKTDIEAAYSAAECDRCGISVPPSELDEYFDSGLCGWCAHMVEKSLDEDAEYGTRIWTPETNLILTEQLVLPPDDFFRSSAAIQVDRRLIDYLRANPEKMHELDPRCFEEFVAELLDRFGYAVRLGPRGRDGGVDVFAEKNGPVGPELTLVQCKKYRADRKVGEPTVKQLWADVTDRRASRGLAVTTSCFSSTALQYIEHRKYQLAGADFDKLATWMNDLRGGK